MSLFHGQLRFFLRKKMLETVWVWIGNRIRRKPISVNTSSNARTCLDWSTDHNTISLTTMDTQMAEVVNYFTHFHLALKTWFTPSRTWWPYIQSNRRVSEQCKWLMGKRRKLYKKTWSRHHARERKKGVWLSSHSRKRKTQFSWDLGVPFWLNADLSNTL